MLCFVFVVTDWEKLKNIEGMRYWDTEQLTRDESYYGLKHGNEKETMRNVFLYQRVKGKFQN